MTSEKNGTNSNGTVPEIVQKALHSDIDQHWKSYCENAAAVLVDAVFTSYLIQKEDMVCLHYKAGMFHFWLILMCFIRGSTS